MIHSVPYGNGFYFYQQMRALPSLDDLADIWKGRVKVGHQHIIAFFLTNPQHRMESSQQYCSTLRSIVGIVPGTHHIGTRWTYANDYGFIMKGTFLNTSHGSDELCTWRSSSPTTTRWIYYTTMMRRTLSHGTLVWLQCTGSGFLNSSYKTGAQK